MSEFHQRLEKEIQSRGLFADGQKILVAVSGGVDSMVLLHALNSPPLKSRWHISIAHFNHQLRGRASDADEKLVRQTAKKLRLKFFGGQAEVKQFAARSKLSVEMAARKLRHEFLARIARAQKIKTIALAHHADDQVELFFLRLLRGAGGEGLAGMKWKSPSPANKSIALARPLLGFSKPDIITFALANMISFREDATNLEPNFLRNRIRNELLPLLKKNYQPAIEKTVLRLMEIAGAESECVREMAGNAAGDFEKIPLAVQRKILQQRLLEAGVAADFDLIEQLRGSQKRVSIGPGLAVARTVRGQIKLINRENAGKKFSGQERKLFFSGDGGDVQFGGNNFRWQIKASKKSANKFISPSRKSSVEIFDADKVGGQIILRHWQAGDRFQRIGSASPVKLQDVFMNQKIPRARRHELVLATAADGEIFWVEGLRISENFKLRPATRRRLVWQWTGLSA